MEKFLLVGLFGVAGAMARYHLSNCFNKQAFPWGTLLVNIPGSFLLGMVSSVPPADSRLQLWLVLAVGTGFLGSLTTFSTMSYEIMTMFKEQKTKSAVIYALVTLILGLAAVLAGALIGRFLIVDST